MMYILGGGGYIDSVSCTHFECKNKTCMEYTGTIPDGYDSLAEWAENANIRAYYILDGNLVYSAAKDAELQAEWAKTGNYNEYSTDEKIIGTWIDGTPLYRKVISLGALPNTTTTTIATGISNATVVKIIGYAKTGAVVIPLPYIDTGGAANGIMFIVRDNGATLYVTAGTNRSAWTGYVTLEYTKG